MHHINERHMTVRHLKLLMVVYLIGRVFSGLFPGKKQIAAMAKIDVDSLEPELGDLVEKRYLVEIVPKYGDLKFTYKLGSMGGTLLRHIVGK